MKSEQEKQSEQENDNIGKGALIGFLAALSCSCAVWLLLGGWKGFTVGLLLLPFTIIFLDWLLYPKDRRSRVHAIYGIGVAATVVALVALIPEDVEDESDSYIKAGDYVVCESDSVLCPTYEDWLIATDLKARDARQYRRYPRRQNDELAKVIETRSRERASLVKFRTGPDFRLRGWTSTGLLHVADEKTQESMLEQNRTRTLDLLPRGLRKEFEDIKIKSNSTMDPP